MYLSTPSAASTTAPTTPSERGFPPPAAYAYACPSRSSTTYPFPIPIPSPIPIPTPPPHHAPAALRLARLRRHRGRGRGRGRGSVPTEDERRLCVRRGPKASDNLVKPAPAPPPPPHRLFRLRVRLFVRKHPRAPRAFVFTPQYPRAPPHALSPPPSPSPPARHLVSVSSSAITGVAFAQRRARASFHPTSNGPGG
ncbi:hypothetical protein B0H11DRAFT_188844 [Mycena galericulata]|nr:hypothetical protein B0H11DRAFT_188844 [Mycena galericulata]